MATAVSALNPPETKADSMAEIQRQPDNKRTEDSIVWLIEGKCKAPETRQTGCFGLANGTS